MSIELDRDGQVALITINRPERLNALDAQHYSDLSDAWCEVRDDSSIRAAIVTGAGERAFTVGADLKSFIPDVPQLNEFWLTQRGQLLNRGLEVWTPVIAAINGHCLGGGMTLMLATDIRVAAEHARFGLPEVKRGVLPANGGTQRILDQLPFAIGMEMLLTGEPVDADTALRWGLVNRVVPARGAARYRVRRTPGRSRRTRHSPSGRRRSSRIAHGISTSPPGCGSSRRSRGSSARATMRAREHVRSVRSARPISAARSRVRSCAASAPNPRASLPGLCSNFRNGCPIT